MRLSAIFIKGHYLFENEQVINFGGKNFYDFNLNENFLEISKTENLEFIENFYGEKISLLSAIVGSNGVGKTSLLNTILLNINRSNLGLIDCEIIVFIFEDKDLIMSFSNDHFKYFSAGKLIINPTNFQFSNKGKDFSTIFYSPVLDVRQYYLSNNESDFFDLSKYRFFENDTDAESGSFTTLSEFHLSENLKRWIAFRNDFDLAFQAHLVSIPAFKSIKIKVNRVFPIISDNFHDISNDFRPFAIFFYKKWHKEYHKNSSNKRKLELNIIIAVIEKIFKILEETGNTYLHEGKVKIEVEKLDNLNFKNSLYRFLDQHYFVKSGSHNEKADIFLPISEIKELIKILLENLPEEKKIEKNRWTEYEVDFVAAVKIINAYQSFITAFSKNFTYDKTILLTFKPEVDLSSGEKGMLDIFSSFYSIKDSIKIENVLLFLDEGDTFFHPNWKIKYVNLLLKILPKIFINKKIQIIFTTHDPLSLSDIPNKNTIYLNNKKNLSEEEKPKKSFGANITDLIADSFFVNDGLIGDFAKEKIGITLEWLKIQGNNYNAKFIIDETILSKIPKFENKTEEINYHKKIIKLVDEPIVQNKLKEMFIEFVSDDFEFKNEQILELEEKLKKLKGK